MESKVLVQFICDMNGIIASSEDTELRTEKTCSGGMNTNYGIVIFPVKVLELLLWRLCIIIDVNTENLQDDPYQCQTQEDLNDHGI